MHKRREDSAKNSFLIWTFSNKQFLGNRFHKPFVSKVAFPLLTKIFYYAKPKFSKPGAEVISSTHALRYKDKRRIVDRKKARKNKAKNITLNSAKEKKLDFHQYYTKSSLITFVLRDIDTSFFRHFFFNISAFAFYGQCSVLWYQYVLYGVKLERTDKRYYHTDVRENFENSLQYHLLSA